MTANQERFGHTVVEPILMTHYVYNARCVYFALGHDPASTQAPEFRKIIVQSVEWGGEPPLTGATRYRTDVLEP